MLAAPSRAAECHSRFDEYRRDYLGGAPVADLPRDAEGRVAAGGLRTLRSAASHLRPGVVAVNSRHTIAAAGVVAHASMTVLHQIRRRKSNRQLPEVDHTASEGGNNG